MTTPQGDSPPADADTHTDVDDQPDPADETPPDEPEQGDDSEQGDDGQEPDEQNGNREAAKWRTRFREAERLLNLTRQSVVDRTVTAAGLDPRLMIAAGHTTESFVGTDGLIDHDALADAIADTKREFRVSPGLLPNPQQGRPGGQPRGDTSWSRALKGV